jgi:hypothetical protein
MRSTVQEKICGLQDKFILRVESFYVLQAGTGIRNRCNSGSFKQVEIS